MNPTWSSETTFIYKLQFLSVSSWCKIEEFSLSSRQWGPIQEGLHIPGGLAAVVGNGRGRRGLGPARRRRRRRARRARRRRPHREVRPGVLAGRGPPVRGLRRPLRPFRVYRVQARVAQLIRGPLYRQDVRKVKFWFAVKYEMNHD